MDCPLIVTKQAGDESQDFCRLTKRICELVSNDRCPMLDFAKAYYEQKKRKFWAEKDLVN